LRQIVSHRASVLLRELYANKAKRSPSGPRVEVAEKHLARSAMGVGYGR
jgi:hypothetical protein